MKKITILCTLTFCVCSSLIAQTKVLFLGNSFTRNQYSVPALFSGLASDAGISVTVDSRTQSGMAVATEQIVGHWADVTSQAKIISEKWDYVVVQDNQGNYANNVGYIPSYAVNANATLLGQIKANDSCTRIIYFAGWGPVGGIYTGDNTIACINRIHSNMILLNNAIADEIVSPIGKAWIESMSQLPSENLYSSDNVHPSFAGVYLTAATIFTSIFKGDFTFINYSGSLNSSTAQTMRSIAFNTVTNSAIYTASHLDAFTPTISVNGSSLTCNGNYLAYQWYSGTTSVGNNSNTYTATSNGIHSVVVTDSMGCLRSSFQVYLTTVDIDNQSHLNEFQLHSLSANNYELISDEIGMLSVYDTQGKLIYSENKTTNRIKIDLSETAKGLYIITLVGKSKRMYQKVQVKY